MINILSYNISWEAMTGQLHISNNKKKQFLCLNNPNNCINNIATFINNFKYDFICLQEASNFNNIYSLLNNYYHTNYSYKYENYPNRENIITMWNHNKYHLDRYIYHKFGNWARPFQVLFFKEGLCLINVHAGHNVNNNYLTLKKYLSEIINLDELNKYKLIICGDFNNQLDTTNILGTDIKLWGKNTTPTCCDFMGYGRVTHAYDHILSTEKNIVYTVHNIKETSDHLPISATIYPNYTTKHSSITCDSIAGGSIRRRKNYHTIGHILGDFSEIALPVVQSVDDLEY